jgi:hypothetical protein
MSIVEWNRTKSCPFIEQDFLMWAEEESDVRNDKTTMAEEERSDVGRIPRSSDRASSNSKGRHPHPCGEWSLFGSEELEEKEREGNVGTRWGFVSERARKQCAIIHWGAVSHIAGKKGDDTITASQRMRRAAASRAFT